MVVELVFVGTELLLGNILNTNAKYLSEECASLGLSVYYQTVVGDNEERLTATIETALNRSDVVILSGGLGPTEDDLTKEVCAKVMGFELKEDAHTREMIEAYLKNSIYKVIPDSNWKQAMVPEGAKILDNPNGTAPGIIMEKDGKTAILLPGPPNELIPLFKEQVRPYLAGQQPEIIYSRMVKICGVGESQAEDMIKDLIDAQTNPTLATYAKTGEVDIRVTAHAADEDEAKKLIKPVIKELKNRFGNAIFTTDADESLEQVVVKLLAKKELTLCTAESCTGGLLAGRITAVPGASEVFKTGFVTYSNKAKRKCLDVSKNILKKCGAVSTETAKEMAKGGAFATDSDACIAITGIAGPDGGTEEKPVGLVYISCYYKHKTVVQECRFKGNRDKVREQSVTRALDVLRRCILEEK